MGIFGKSFNRQVEDAVAAIKQSGLGVTDLKATVDGRLVTLEGTADNLEAKGRVMAEFNKRVNTENTFNRISVKEALVAPPIASTGAPQKEETTLYEVQKGDTLSALALRFYGKANLYMKIFEANRDILNDPNLIKIGQKLKIPK